MLTLLIAALFSAGMACAQNTQQPPVQQQVPSVDSDPVRSPDAEVPRNPEEEIRKEPSGFVLQTEVEEVVLNITVLEGKQLVENLKAENFRILEDGVEQKILSFQHVDVPVSIGVVVDNSGRCRGSVRR